MCQKDVQVLLFLKLCRYHGSKKVQALRETTSIVTMLSVKYHATRKCCLLDSLDRRFLQDPQRVFTNNIVVRFHPGLEMDGDEIITIVCRYPPPVAPPAPPAPMYVL